jgi:ABC-type lipoprotein export system ATPase subunit
MANHRSKDISDVQNSAHCQLIVYSIENVFIAVMGVTGSGKTSFISLCTKQPAPIRHGLENCKIPFALCFWLTE